jgi:RimJ/RimL family protein N-acetyltransferase
MTARLDELRTDRLLLRHWRESDREPFAALNADPAVMRYFPATRDRAASDAFIDRRQAQLERDGWGLWATELLATGELIGFVGLNAVAVGELPPGPCTEVGWRLAAHTWGHGYAPEAGRAALDVAFAQLRLPEVVSFTTRANAPSRRVMEKLGLRHDPSRDFRHPALPDRDGHPHVLYAVTAEQWSLR